MNRIKKQSKNMQHIEPKTLRKNSQDDIYAEDFQFEIETSRKNTESRRGPLDQQSYVERLEAKIQNQAKRLSELEKYKFKNEMRSKQLDKEESIPSLNKSTKTKQSNIEREKEKANQKYDTLYSKYSKLLNEFNEFALRKTSEVSIIKNTFGSNISSESSNSNITPNSNGNLNLNLNTNVNAKIKEAYNTIKELTEVKEKVTEELRQETLKVEEQKNIISILKQTLDSEFIKLGILTKHITPANLIDFIQLKSESENYRKQLVLSQALVDSLKTEIEEISKDRDKVATMNKELASSNQNLIEKMSNTEREMSNKVTKYQNKIGAMKKELQMINVKLLEDSNANANTNNIQANDNGNVNSYDSRFIESTLFESNNQRATNHDMRIKLDDSLNKYHLLLDEHKLALSQLNELRKENAKLSNKIEALIKDKGITIKDYHNYSQLKEEHKLSTQRLDEVNKTNANLRKLIDEADKKLSDNYSMNKDIKARIQALEAELKMKNNENKTNNKYITGIKADLNKLYTTAIKYCHQYNDIINEDYNNAVVTEQFSNSISAFISQLNNISNQYSNQNKKDSNDNNNNSDSNGIDVIGDLLKIITNEFQSIYSMCYGANSNSYKNESNIKTNILKKDANSVLQDNTTLIKQIDAMSAKNEQCKAKNKQLKRDIKLLNETIENKESQLKEVTTYSNSMTSRLSFMANDKDGLQSVLQLISKCIGDTPLNKLIQEYIIVNDGLFKLTNDKIKVEEKLLLMQREYGKMKEKEKERGKEGNELIYIINKEQNALKELLYEFQNKIEDNQARLNEIKSTIQQYQHSRCYDYNSNNNINDAKLNMTLSDPHMFKTIHQETSNAGRRLMMNRHSGTISGSNYKLKNGSQLTDYEDSDMDNRRDHNSTINAVSKTIKVNGRSTMRVNNNYTYEMI